jgi:cation transport ATPase
MPINVVCTGCKKRFTVSEKFAGQKGPCPKCKTEIVIPALEDEVVVHAPDAAGPKDSKGQSVLKPILREETTFSIKIAVGVGVAAIVVLVFAWMLRNASDETKGIVGALSVILLAPPLVWGGYTFLRNSDLEPYRGQELLIRVAACAAAYAFLWGVYAWIAWVLEIDNFELWQVMAIAVGAVLAGGFAAFASLDLDYLVGLVHYGLYLVVTVLLGFMAKMDLF